MYMCFIYIYFSHICISKSCCIELWWNSLRTIHSITVHPKRLFGAIRTPLVYSTFLNLQLRKLKLREFKFVTDIVEQSWH